MIVRVPLPGMEAAAMRGCVSAFYFLAALLPAVAAGAESRPPAVGVRIWTPRRDYLVGEPVPIDVVIRNPSRRELVLNKPTAGDIQFNSIFISLDSKNYRMFVGWYGILCGQPTPRPLGPGEEWVFQPKVFYSPAGPEGVFINGARSHPGGLAFDRAGIYFVKVIYSVGREGVQGSEPVESNGIKIRIRTPEGVDARARRLIQDPEMLAFLQFGQAREGRGTAIVRKLTSLIRDHPDSAYCDALRNALWDYYEANGGPRSRSGDWDEVRDVLGVLEAP
jgi:hypothetical protein